MKITKRVLLSTGMFVGGTMVGDPTVGIGVMAGSVFGNTLSDDIYKWLSRDRVDPTANHHLQQLTGNAIALLIEAHERDERKLDNPSAFRRLFRRKDGELTALAGAARQHWDKLEPQAFTGESELLKDEQIHRLFAEFDREGFEPAGNDPPVSADEWSEHLAELAKSAKDTAWSLTFNTQKRNKLAEFIAPRFALAVREVVKADLDPDVGTGGRVFVALHLDLMRAMSASIASIKDNTTETLTEAKRANAGIERIEALVAGSLDAVQQPKVFHLCRSLQKQMQQASASLEQIIQTLAKHSDEHAEMLAMLERVEARQLEQRQQNPDQPLTLSPEDQALLDHLKASEDERTKLKASVLDPDEETDGLLAAARQRQAAEAFELDMLEGKRWYFARPVPQPDRAAPIFERAVESRPRDIDARIYAANAHNGARLGDKAEHQRRAIELYEGTLALACEGSLDWAMTQNNLGAAYGNLPTGDRGENLRRAIAAYEAALEVRTRVAHPVDWATAQNNLGAAYGDLPTGDRGENLRRAIAAYKAALEVCTRDAHPVDWAMTQNNRAVAVADLAEQPGEDRAARLRQAIAFSKAALLVRTPEAFPSEHAATLKNLGIDRRAYEAAGGEADVPFDAIEPAD